jgi:PAS domain S-box-containing protein
MATIENIGSWNEQLSQLARARGQGPGIPDLRARQQNALLAFGRRTSSRPQWATLLQDAVSLLVEVLGVEMGCTAVISGDGGMAALNVTRVDSQGKPVQVIARAVAVDPATSICGYAMRSGTPVVTAQLNAEHRFRDTLLQELGIVSGLVVPLPVDEHPFGTIGVFSLEAREFTLDDVNFVETIAHLLTASVGRLRAEEQLRHQQTLSNAVLDTIEALVAVLDRDGRVTWINRATQQVSGFSPTEIYGRPFAAALLPKQEAATVNEALERLDQGPQTVEATLLRKNAAACFIRWNCRAVTLRDGTIQSIVATGVPIAAPPTAAPQNAPQEIPAEQAFAPVPAAASGRELRTSPRRTFQFQQSIAPMYGSTLPSRNKFFEVNCKDISAGGISFFLSQHPDFTSLLVALGRPPGVTYFTARVVRVTEVQENGKTQFMVGCRFIGRVHL